MLLFFFEVLRSACSVFRSHDINSTGSDCAPIRNLFLLAFITACKNSCGLTCRTKRWKIKLLEYWNDKIITSISEANLSFKVSCMPDLPSEFTKSLNKLRLTMLIVFWDKEKIPQGGNSHQGLNCYIHKISLLYVIKSNLKILIEARILAISENIFVKLQENIKLPIRS